MVVSEIFDFKLTFVKWMAKYEIRMLVHDCGD